DAVRARARARELRHVSRPARLVERSHAGRPHADALPALPHCEQASGDALRQGPDHHEQEQSDVRPIVRELPFQYSRLEPSVGPVLHAVTGDLNMRRLSSIALGLLIGLGGPAYAQSAVSDTQAQAPAQQTPSPAATPDTAESSRSLFDIAPNQVLFG